MPDSCHDAAEGTVTAIDNAIDAANETIIAAQRAYIIS
jgi:hypothetical protein